MKAKLIDALNGAIYKTYDLKRANEFSLEVGWNRDELVPILIGIQSV